MPQGLSTVSAYVAPEAACSADGMSSKSSEVSSAIAAEVRSISRLTLVTSQLAPNVTVSPLELTSVPEVKFQFAS